MNATLETESTRLREQCDLDSTRTRAERNLLGQFATPPALALAIAQYAWRRLGRRRGSFRFLDPAIGTGAFYSAALQTFDTSRIADAVGAEIDTSYSETARRLWAGAGLRVVNDDFTALRPPGPSGTVDLVLANPPYVRHHHLGVEAKDRQKQLVRERLGIEVSGLAGLYCYFLLLCDAWLASNALSMWLIPSEFMDVNYGGCLKTYLTRHVTLEHIHRFCPSEAQFKDALVSSAVVVFRKRRPANGHRVKFSFGGALSRPRCAQHVALAELERVPNWTSLPTSDGRIPRGHAQVTLGEFFSIRRGIATGNNAFFILSKSDAASLGVPAEFSRPILPSPRHLRQEIIDATAQGDPHLPAPLVVVDCPLVESAIQSRFPDFWNYLQRGKRRGIHKGYLTSRRDPWYSQERRTPAPFLCTYMGRSRERPFRFLWNKSLAIAANVYLLLYPKESLQVALDADASLYERVFETLRQIKPEDFKSAGRVYGGGLHKMEPAELMRLPADSLARLIGRPSRQPAS